MEFGYFAQAFVPNFEVEADPGAEHRRLVENLDFAVECDRNGIKYVTGGEWAPLAPTPSDVVWGEGKVRLRRYRRQGAARLGPPVLCFLGLVGRAYVFDLWKDNSIVAQIGDNPTPLTVGAAPALSIRLVNSGPPAAPFALPASTTGIAPSGLANGNALPCCIAPFTDVPYDDLILGNVNDGGFNAVWNGDRYREFRRRHQSDDPPEACRRCGLDWSL